MIQDGCVLTINDGLDVKKKKKQTEKKQNFEKCCLIHMETYSRKKIPKLYKQIL